MICALPSLWKATRCTNPRCSRPLESTMTCSACGQNKLTGAIPAPTRCPYTNKTDCPSTCGGRGHCLDVA